MKKLLVLLFLLNVALVQSSPELFFSSYFESFLQETPQEIYVNLTNSGVSPKEVTIKQGQTVTWVNQRTKLPALIIGVREINKLRSSFLKPGEEFSWQFNNTGKFVYVDGILIGTHGKVIVE